MDEGALVKPNPLRLEGRLFQLDPTRLMYDWGSHTIAL